MMRHIVITLAGLMICRSQTPTIEPVTMGSTIFGTVETDEPKLDRGRRIASAWVTLVRRPTVPREKLVPFSKSGPARLDGAFSFTGLQPGTYQLCAQLLKSVLLNPCE